MLGRIACAGLCAALIGCYSAPKPDCGFVCGDQGECPDDYHCASVDNRCHRNGTPDSLVCGDGGIVDAPPPPPPPKMDAAPPADAKPADAMPDAPPPDAAVDAAVDAN